MLPAVRHVLSHSHAHARDESMTPLLEEDSELVCVWCVCVYVCVCVCVCDCARLCALLVNICACALGVDVYTVSCKYMYIQYISMCHKNEEILGKPCERRSSHKESCDD